MRLKWRGREVGKRIYPDSIYTAVRLDVWRRSGSVMGNGLQVVFHLMEPGHKIRILIRERLLDYGWRRLQPGLLFMLRINEFHFDLLISEL